MGERQETFLTLQNQLVRGFGGSCSAAKLDLRTYTLGGCTYVSVGGRRKDGQ